MRKYDSYKDSGIEWLGKVPEHWKEKRLKELATIFGGKDYKHIVSDDGQYDVIGSGGSFEKATKYLYNRESVLLGRKGTIDKPLYVNKAFWAVDTMYFTKIPSYTHGRYFFYLCTTIEFGYYKYGSALPSMTQGDLNRILFFTPAYKEQTAIAQYLDTKTQAIDKKVSLLEKKVGYYKELRKSIINETVTKGLDKTVMLKDSGLGFKIAENFEVKRLKDLCKIINGYAFKSNEYVDSGLPVIRIGDISNDIDFNDIKFAPIENRLLAKESKVKNGDILMAMTGATIGKNSFFNTNIEAYLNQRVCSFRVNKFVNNKYLGHFISSIFFQDFVQLICGGSAQENISKAQLEIFNIIIPQNIEEQIAIATYLDHKTQTIDKIVGNIQNQISTLKELRKTLINDVVTGKIKVVA